MTAYKKKEEKNMKDAYEILGVSRNASDEEIKNAYRELLRKYHPDNYAGTNNPLAPLAEEKFKEVQQAYNEIMSERQNNPFGYGNTGSYNTGNTGQYSNQGVYNNNYRNQYDVNSGYYGRPANYRGQSCGTGNFCCDLWCLDTMCECVGGDLCACMQTDAP